MVLLLARVSAFLADFLLMFALAGLEFPLFEDNLAPLMASLSEQLRIADEALLLPFNFRIIKAFIYMAVYRVCFGLVLGVSFSQWCFGLTVHFREAGSIKAFVRNFLNELTRPLLIFHLPLLYSRRSFSEWGSSQSLKHTSIKRTFLGPSVMGIGLFLSLNSPFISDISKVNFLSKEQTFAHKDLLSNETDFDRFEFYDSRLLGLNFITDFSGGRYLILPHPLRTKEKPLFQFLIFDQDRRGKGTFTILHRDKVVQWFETAQEKEQLFSSFNNINISDNELPSEGRFLNAVLQYSPWFSLKTFYSHGIEHSGFLSFQSSLLKTANLVSPSVIKEHHWKKMKLLTLSSDPHNSKNILDLLMIPLNRKKVDLWKLSFSRGREESLKPLLEDLFKGARWLESLDDSEIVLQKGGKSSKRGFAFISMDFMAQYPETITEPKLKSLDTYLSFNFEQLSLAAIEQNKKDEMKLLKDSITSVISFYKDFGKMEGLGTILKSLNSALENKGSKI